MSNIKEIMNQIFFSECEVYKKAFCYIVLKVLFEEFYKATFSPQEFSRQVFALDENVVFRGTAAKVEDNGKDVNIYVFFNKLNFAIMWVVLRFLGSDM